MKSWTVSAICTLVLAFGNSAHAAATEDPLAAGVRAGLNAAAAAKLAVTEQYIQTGQWPGSNDAAGFVAPVGNPADIVIGQGGVITVTYRAPAAIAGKSVVLTPSVPEPGTVNWACRAVGVPAAALPAHCR